MKNDPDVIIIPEIDLRDNCVNKKHINIESRSFVRLGYEITIDSCEKCFKNIRKKVYTKYIASKMLLYLGGLKK